MTRGSAEIGATRSGASKTGVPKRELGNENESHHGSAGASPSQAETIRNITIWQNLSVHVMVLGVSLFFDTVWVVPLMISVLEDTSDVPLIGRFGQPVPLPIDHEGG
ncbi:MAG: hypothetical protein JWP89_1936, partial [Schlesneria sp.]|nr:hypothetical protein [Schlesneria sp.]